MTVTWSTWVWISNFHQPFIHIGWPQHQQSSWHPTGPQCQLSKQVGKDHSYSGLHSKMKRRTKFTQHSDFSPVTFINQLSKQTQEEQNAGRVSKKEKLLNTLRKSRSSICNCHKLRKFLANYKLGSICHSLPLIALTRIHDGMQYADKSYLSIEWINPPSLIENICKKLTLLLSPFWNSAFSKDGSKAKPTWDPASSQNCGWC